MLNNKELEKMKEEIGIGEFTEKEYDYLNESGLLNMYFEKNKRVNGIIWQKNDELEIEDRKEYTKKRHEDLSILIKDLNILKTKIEELISKIESNNIAKFKVSYKILMLRNKIKQSEVDEKAKVYKKESIYLETLQRFKKVVSWRLYDVNYFLYSNILTEKELINDIIWYDTNKNRKSNEFRIMEAKCGKAGLSVAETSVNKYSILTNFSVFNNIEDKAVYKNLKFIKEIIEKEDVLSDSNKKVLIEDCVKLLKKNKGNSFKTNNKNIFILNEYLTDVGIKTLSKQFITNYIGVGNIIAPETLINEELRRYIIDLYRLGYRNLIVVGKNNEELNCDYHLLIDENAYFTVKVININSLIAYTRDKLYGEQLEEKSDYLEYKKKIEDGNIEMEKYLKDRPEHVGINARSAYLHISELWKWKCKQNDFKEINNLFKRSLFIFQEMSWNEVVLNFRLNRIIISSGMNNKKSLVNTLEFKLSLVIDRMFRDYVPDKYIHELVTNSSENLKDELYKTKLESKYEILAPLNIKDLEKITRTKKIYLDLRGKEDSDSAVLAEISPCNFLKHSQFKNTGEKPKGSLPFKGGKSYHTLTQNKYIRRYSTEVKKTIEDEDRNLLFFKKKLYKNEFLSELSRIINDNNTTKEERQFRIEDIWNEMERKGYKDLDLLHLKSNKYFIMARETLDLKYQDNTLKRKFPNYFELLKSVKLLMITFSLTLTLITRKTNGWNNVVATLGERLFYQMYTDRVVRILQEKGKDRSILAYREVSSEYSFDKFLTEISAHNNFKFSCIKLGDFFLGIFCSEPHILFKRSLVERDDDSHEHEKEGVYIVAISSNLNLEILRYLYIDPASIPMLCPPREWTNDKDGGNLKNFLFKNNIITGNNSHGHEMKNKDNLYKTINFLSKIEFKINTDLLKFLFSEKGNLLIKSVIERKEVTSSEKVQFYTNLILAEAFSNETFYLPLKADFRGRLYVTSFFLNYQGSEIGKALVYFNKGEPLTKKGLDNLYIYGANLFNPSNLNKENHEERINWITNNLSNIYEMDIKFLLQAENIWLFTSFCLIMKKLKYNPNLLVHFPIFIDATCSGIQHIAGMIKDTDLGVNVNLTKQNKEDKVQDIYTKLLNTINYAIFLEGNDSNSKFPNLKHVKLTRSEVKAPIMTKTYNVSLIGIKNQLLISIKDRERKTDISMIEKEKVLEKVKKFEDIKLKLYSHIHGNPVYLDYKDIFKLAEIVESCIFSNFPKLKLVYDFFKNICKVFNRLGIPILWITPSGLIITQNYYKSVNTKMAISFAGVTKNLIIKEWTKDMDKRAQINAVIPNIVHSLDASHLMQVIKTCESCKLTQIMPIHDCFGCLPNNLNCLFKIIKIEFINIYSKEEFLTQYQNYVENHLKVIGFEIKESEGKKFVIYNTRARIELPVAPEIGKLNLNEVLDSQYMFN
uniref:DNA-directed RNA polymerase n=1 Tax=Termitomyces sp. T70a TaxID=2811474 RepID=A0A8F1ACB9_9AGAR|nr:RNA polymerase [Termitomyces sp. T70a]